MATCKVCGLELVNRRSDAQFCGPVCRKRYSRRAENIRRHAKDALRSLAYMKHLATDEHLETVLDQELTRIASALSELSVTVATVTDNDKPEAVAKVMKLLNGQRDNLRYIVDTHRERGRRVEIEGNYFNSSSTGKILVDGRHHTGIDAISWMYLMESGALVEVGKIVGAKRYEFAQEQK